MNKIFVFTDTHFGVRKNSMIWWNSQKRFLRDQLIPDLKKSPGSKLFHLGDVFDSRAILNTYILAEVQNIFKELSELSSEFIIIAGNHDFYSPDSDEFCTLEQVFGGNPKIKLVTRDIYEDDSNNVFIPWFVGEREDMEELTRKYVGKTIWAHADLILNNHINPYTRIYSGHIHTPRFVGPYLKNLGSCYPLNFGDSNQDRYYYIVDEGSGDIIERVPNRVSIKFWRFSDLRGIEGSVENIEDYIELVLTPDYVTSHVDDIRTIRGLFKNTRISFAQDLNVIKNKLDNENNSNEYFDLGDIIQNLIPENLQEKYEIIKESIPI